MKKTLLFAAFIAMALGFYSCSDDNPVSSTQVDEYFVLHKTANWTSEVYTVDSETGENTGDPTYVYTSIDRETTRSNKDCFEFSSWDYDYLGDQSKSDPTYSYFYTENNKLYTHSNLINRYIGSDELGNLLPIIIPDGWLLFVDGDNDTWEMLSMDVDDLVVPFMGQDVTVENAKFIVTGSQEGDDVLTVDGTDYECKKFVITFALTGDVFTQPLTGKLDMTLWLGKEVGMLKQTISPFEITVAETTSLMKFDGTSSTVIEFDLNK